jgi:hypothetical protein
MNKRSDKVEKRSRRDFTKSVAASLIAAPLLTALAGRKTSAKNGLAPLEAPRKISGCEIRDDQFLLSDHIPPTSFDEGSFLIELGHKLQRQADQSGPRPKKFIVAPADPAKQYGQISMLQVLTEMEHRFDYIAYIFEPEHSAQLQFWFKKLKKANPSEGAEEIDFEPINPDVTPANVLVKGGPPMVLEMDRDHDGRKATSKTQRLHKFVHKGFGKNFRIHQWQVVGANGRDVLRDRDGHLIQGGGEDGYRFLVSFFDPTRLRSKG